MKKKQIYLIGNSHLDIVWQWRWIDGFSEIKATFKSVLDRMKEFPDLKFTSACGSYYEWIEKSCPDMFAEIQRYVKEGRWCIAGGWFLQPDCNLPCGESFARHSLITQRYFLEKFGKTAEVGYNVDSFGHNGNLPQILLKSGMKAYVFMRPSEREKDLPQNLFIWEGVDGSKVPTYRIHRAYNFEAKFLGEFRDFVETQSTDQMMFFGFGNHGGGPTIKMIEEYEQERAVSDDLHYATVDEFFAEQGVENLPIVKGDLQYHARGCYSANSTMKAYNRNAENAMIQAEIFSVLSERLVDTKYPAKKYKKAWKNILFNQFHDVLAGCAIEPAYADASYLYGETMSIAEQEINFALQQISWQIDTLKGHKETYFRESSLFPFVHNELGSPVVVFNSLPFDRKIPVRIYPQCTRVEDEDGRVLDMQIIRGYQTDQRFRSNTLFYLDVPACGYAVARIFTPKETELQTFVPNEDVFSCGEDFIENEYVRVTFDKRSGAVSSFYDKTARRELLSGMAANCVFSDEGYDTWAHEVYCFDRKLGEFSDAEMHVLENGNVRVTMRVTSHYGDTVLRQDFTLYKHSPIVHVAVKVRDLAHKTMLRLSFPVRGKDVHSVTEIPFGTKEHKRDKAEYPCGKWFSLYGEEGGVTVYNKTKSSYGVEDSTAYFTVLRTSAYLDHFGAIDEFCSYLDDGIQEFEYGIAPFESLRDNACKSQEFSSTTRAILETFHKGKLPTEYRGVKIASGTVALSAFKRAEDGKGNILRIYETSGNHTSAVIECDCLGVKIETSLSAYEAKSFRIENGRYCECDFIEREL